MRIGKKQRLIGILGILLAMICSQHAGANQPRVILVTGFEPFGGDATNGSWEAVQPLDGKHIGNVTVVVAQLPVLWGKAEERLHALVQADHPDAVVSFGQAGDEPIRLEAVARNVREDIPDNKGLVPPQHKVYGGGDATLNTGLPLRELARRLHTAGIPVNLSRDAGTYLCNDIFYTLMYDPGTDAAKRIPRGFVHVPPLGAMVRTAEGHTVFFDRHLLQKTAKIIVQTVAETLTGN